MRNKMVMIGLGLVAFLVVSPLPGAFATPITVESNSSIVYQQTENSPCVVGNTSCNQPQVGNGQSALYFPATEESGTPNGQGGTYSLTSPTYIVGSAIVPLSSSKTSMDLPYSYIPATFSIGIDENIAAGASGGEVLVYFQTYVNGVLNNANTFNGSYAIPNLNNGNGFSDLILNGFSLNAGDNVYFVASVSNDTDGMEQFFIIPQGTPQVPEPSTLLLLGGGLVGLAFYGRKAFKR